MLRALILFIFLSTSFAHAAVRTGPINPNVINHFYPEMNPVGNAFRVPISWAGIQGTAEIGAAGTLGSLLDYAKRGLGGPALNAALMAATVCLSSRENDPFDICHGDAPETMQPTVNSEDVYSAVNMQGYTVDSVLYPDITSACNQVASIRTAASTSGWIYTFAGVYVDSWPIHCKLNRQTPTATYYDEDAQPYAYQQSYLGCSSGDVLTNSAGVPMPLTGTYCVNPANYQCNSGYLLSTDHLACNYQEQQLTDSQAADLLKPQLLNYYADQLFRDKDLNIITDPFEQSDTTFDPDLVPSNFPTSWETFKQWVDWVRNGKAQTSDPLAPNYLTPQQYDYTNNYITNNDTSNVTNNTSNAYPTTETVSSADPLTQEQYEESTKKMDDATAEAIDSISTDPIDNAWGDSGIDTPNDKLDDIANGNIDGLPDITPPNFPSYSSCQKINLSWQSYSAEFPTDNQCLKMEQAKKAFGYILYLLTAVGLILELFRRVD